MTALTSHNIDKEYKEWLTALSERYKSRQVIAAAKVNSELLSFYWSLGCDIVEKHYENKYGSHFFERLSADLRKCIPNAAGFSVRNLKYTRAFYQMYSNWQQPVANSAEIQSLPLILRGIPWGHHTVLIDKFKDDPNTALLYAQRAMEEGWSRSTLVHAIDAGLLNREGKAITNFRTTIAPPIGEMAQQLTKDPYIFDFTELRIPYVERELKQQLLSNITDFLLELGKGFAYIGREYKLKIGDSERFTDLLFYHIKLRCYVVVEVKIEKFDPAHLGQLGLYVSAVNHILKDENDNPTIGLLICKTKDNIMAQYSLEGYNLPLGISEYSLSKFFPDKFKGSIPSIDDIESQFK